VFDGPALIGMGGLRPHAADTGEIKRMRVDPRYQRRGLGQEILDRLEVRARELRYRRLVLDTTTLQLAAQALYRTNGYVETGRGVQGRFELIFFEKVL
jgi:ribosomal protein S18 acetylase RimI-like enzyme